MFRLVINGYDDEMSVMMVVRNILGCSVTEARAKLAKLPAVVIESEDKARVEGLARLFAKGNVEVAVETRNGLGELVGSDSYDTQKETEAKRKAQEEAKRKVEETEEFYNTGEDYFYRRNGKIKNYKEAVKWYRKAAELGHTHAQYSLGGCYYYGRGVEEDKNEAAKWYRKAADQGHSDAKECLETDF